MFHWQRESASAELASSLLNSMATLLQENQALLGELQKKPYNEEGSGILNSYLIKLRREGVKSSAPIKEGLDRLTENNTALLALIGVYSADAKTPEFKAQSDQFRRYAIAWKDRWNSIMELFMSGGNYPAAEIRSPAGFLHAVQAEIAARH
jgi:hypothetical protein